METINVISCVPKIVLNTILKDGYINAITNFDNVSRNAYTKLKEKSKMDNFFFGIYEYDNLEDVYYLCQMSSDNNDIMLHMSIPKEELFAMKYYDFSDLIYAYDCEPDPEFIEIISNTCMNNDIEFISNSESKNPIQLIFKKIEKNWIRHYEQETK